MVKLCVFEALHFRGPHNEMPYVNAQGELKRIDRLLEFEKEGGLDYKTGASHGPAPCRAQKAEYRSAMQSVHADKMDGTLNEI